MLHFDQLPAAALAQRFGTPLYVYEEQTIRQAYRRLRAAFAFTDLRLHYAMKANANPWILRLLLEEGAHIDAVSAGEVHLALAAGCPAHRILYTQSAASDADMAFALQRGVLVNAESLSQLARLGSLAPGSRVCVRLNIYLGGGHHSHVITGGPDSKFGIDWEQWPQVQELLTAKGLRLVGLHCHIGSGIRDASLLAHAVSHLFHTARNFGPLEFLDFGGGLGVPYRDEEGPLDLAHFASLMEEKYRAFCQDTGTSPAIALEPGRFLVATAGNLLCRVTSVKQERKHLFVGTDTGFNHLVRPAFYGSFHRIDAVTPRPGELRPTVVTGNLCEGGDLFTRDEHGPLPRLLPPLQEGDLLVLREAGAYGFAMSSRYNSVPLPAEVLVDGNQAKLIRRRETLEDLLTTVPTALAPETL
jgi:diaminopimelate decarboxylase